MIKLQTTIVPLAMLLSACATGAPQAATDPLAKTVLRDAGGAESGTIEIARDGAGLLLIARVAGMAPGKALGAHLHTVGTCAAPDFASAGPHLNPGARQHGSANPAGSHLGDLPNLQIGPAGSGMLAVRLPGEPEAVLSQLFDGDGTAVVIHAQADDYRTDPSGNSGTRIACGALIRSVD